MVHLEQQSWPARATRFRSVPESARRRPRPATAAARGPGESTPRWYRPAFLALLAAVAALYLVGLSASGYANTFYSAAVQAGTESWKAWFFGSLDSASFITVDKPPASLWIMGLSARIFGFNSWSLLVPQALEGVAAAGLLCAAVRRAVRRSAGGRAGAAAGLIAGAAMAVLPAAVLIFRFDNPDALMVLLIVAAAYCVVRALERGRTWWLVGAGAAFGFGFLTKSGEALLEVPAFAAAYLVAAPVRLRRRVWQLLVAGLAMLVSAGWWIAAVLLTPAADRPYVGGSTDNNPLELAFGYNGLSRLLGGGGNGGGGGGFGGFGGSTGLLRLFRGEFGLEISWLLPAALVLLAGAVWVTARAPRTDPARAALIIFGGWLLSTGLTFSFMQGIIHPYYTVALAPAIGALVGIGAVLLWQRRPAGGRGAATVATGLLALAAGVTCAWGFELLRTDASFHPWVKWLEVPVAAVAVILLVVTAFRYRSRWRMLAAAGTLGLVALAVPVSAWGAATAATAHTGAVPTAVSGSSSAGVGGSGGPGGGFGGGSGRGFTGMRSGTMSGEMPKGMSGRGSGQGFPSGSGSRSGAPSGGGMGGVGGMGGTGSVSAALAKALEKTTTTWAAATDGSSSAATLELASGGKAVMAIGGFTGSDPAPTLAQFEKYVKDGEITYYIAGGGGGGGPNSGGVSSQITTWVEAHYTSATIGGETVYLLLQPKS